MIKYTLRPYQQKAVAKALTCRSGFAELFDPGLGKTITALKIAEEKHLPRVLIVAPKSLLSVWLDEIENGTDWKVPMLVWDSVKASTKTFARGASALLQSPAGVLLVNVEAFSAWSKKKKRLDNNILKRLLDSYTAAPCLMILDESTKIANHKAQRTAGVLHYGERAAFRLALTGTDVASGLLNLYTQFQFVDPYIFQDLRNFYSFRARYAVLKELPLNQGRPVKIVVGYKKVEELMERIEPYSFRAKKETVMPELPDKIFQTIKIEPNREQRLVYQQLKEQLVTEYHGELLTVQAQVALFTRFRQLAGGFFPNTGELIGKSNPKLDYLRDQLEDSTDQVIIWANFTPEIEALKKLFGDSSVTFYGGNTAEENTQNRHRFEKGEARIMIANPSSGAYGQNWMFCTQQYFFSLPAKSEDYLQCLDRSHRIGTRENVLYRTLQLQGTVDERMAQLITQKKSVMDAFHAGTLTDFLKKV